MLSLQIHPDYRHLIEEEMFAWAEENLAAPDDEGGLMRLTTFVFDYDVPRQLLLTARSYEKTPYGGVSRRLRLGGQPLPTPLLAEGYGMRPTRAGEHRQINKAWRMSSTLPSIAPSTRPLKLPRLLPAPLHSVMILILSPQRRTTRLPLTSASPMTNAISVAFSNLFAPIRRTAVSAWRAP